MAFYSGNENDRKDYRQRDDDAFRTSVYRIESRSTSPRLEDEKKMRREIANSNERRRMQSINAGFQSLRALLPKGECDKLSKAAILQGTVDYVQQLEQEKSFLLSQNIKLSRSVQSSNDSDGSCNDLPLPKRKRRKTELVSHLLDEGIGSASPSSQSETEADVRHEVAQLRQQLEHERAWRLRLEEELLNGREAKLLKVERVDHDYTEHELATKAPRNPRKAPRLSLQEHEIVLVTIPEHSVADHPAAQSGLPDERPNPPQVVHQSYPCESTIPVTYATNRPRQNLAAIVEAIRHVEGYHMFQDDPPERESASPESSPSDEHSFQGQFISRAPVVQNRAGVIVSNTS